MIHKNQKDHKLYRDSIYFTSAARVGFRHLLLNLKIPKDKYILLPSYIGYSIREGSGVLDPIEECGINYKFYRIKRNLSADLEDIGRKISMHNIFSIFVIHYFGFLQSDISEIKNICNSHNIFLIEDCAHCLKSNYDGTPLGDFGDFSLFSIHKVLPTPDGGILKVNRKDISIPVIGKNDKISFKSLEIYATSQFDEISYIRIKNYKLLQELLSSMNSVEILYPQLPDGIVPMNFPILIKSKNRFDIYKRLMHEGVETMALYYQLVTPIIEDEYPVSHELSGKILNLPIHQELSENEIYFIADTLYKALK